MNYNLIVIFGPTASGKTTLAVKLADKLNTEIISADSRQVYCGLDIGTGKDLCEYRINGRPITYHLIDIVDPGEDFALFHFYKSFFELFQGFLLKKQIPILAGGTSLYIHSIIANYKLLEVPLNYNLRAELETYEEKELISHLKSLNPALHNITDLESRERLIRAIEIATFKNDHPGAQSSGENINIIPFIIGVTWDRPLLRERITKRLIKRIEEGMIEEVKNLHEKGYSWERLEYFGLEYKYVSLYLQGKLSYKEMFERLNIKIHQFAKKQDGWLRKMEREGFKINRVEKGDFNKAYRLIMGSIDADL